MAVTIRPATPVDARAIAEVHVASWRWAYRDALPAGVLDSLSIDERELLWLDTLASPDGAGSVLVAEADGDIVGFIEGGASGDEFCDASCGEIHALYLVESWAGAGTGGSLLAAATALLTQRGFTRAILWVLDANARARAFYERAGWLADGSTDTYPIGDERMPIVRYAIDL